MKLFTASLVFLSAFHLTRASPLLHARQDATDPNILTTVSIFSSILMHAAPFGTTDAGFATLTAAIEPVLSIANGTTPFSAFADSLKATQQQPPSINDLDPLRDLLCKLVHCPLSEQMLDPVDPITFADQLTAWADGTTPLDPVSTVPVISPTEARAAIVSMGDMAMRSRAKMATGTPATELSASSSTRMFERMWKRVSFCVYGQWGCLTASVDEIADALHRMKQAIGDYLK